MKKIALNICNFITGLLIANTAPVLAQRPDTTTIEVWQESVPGFRFGCTVNAAGESVLVRLRHLREPREIKNVNAVIRKIKFTLRQRLLLLTPLSTEWKTERARFTALIKHLRAQCEGGLKDETSPTPTSSETSTPEPSATVPATTTPTNTPTATPTLSPSASATVTPTSSPIPSATTTSTPTRSPTATSSATPTPTPLSTTSPTPTPTSQSTPTPTPSLPTSPSINLVVAATKVSGPAPLAVAFDASGTTGLAGNDFVGATFFWDFGDASTIWPHSGKSTNRSGGFNTGHVYQTPGSYTVRVKVIDAAGNRSVEHSIPITVLNPGQVYTETFCISPTGNDTSCAPGGVALGTMSQVLERLGPNRRFLFKRGYVESFNSSISMNNLQGPIYFGAYGQGATPELLFPFMSGEASIYLNNSNDLVFEDLNIIGINPGTNSGPIGFWIDSNRILLQRMLVSRFNRNIHFAGSNGPIRTGNFVTSSVLRNSGYFTLTISGTFRLTTILGNYFTEAAQGHIRNLESQQTHVAHNMFVGSFAVKSHAGASVISDNFFDGGTYTRIAYGTGGAGTPCDAAAKLNHLVEGNLFLGISPTYSGGVSGITIECGGRVHIRSNLFFRVPSAVSIGADAYESGFQGPVKIYNNYSGDDRGPSSTSSFIRLSNLHPATDIRNNVVSFPTLNFNNGTYTAVIERATSGIANLNINHNLWYLPSATGVNGNTPGMFAITGAYPNHVGYSSTIISPATVQYFGILQPLSTWRSLGLDTESLFINPGDFIVDSQGQLRWPAQSPLVNSGDPTTPFFRDFYGRERTTQTAPIGPFLQ